MMIADSRCFTMFQLIYSSNCIHKFNGSGGQVSIRTSASSVVTLGWALPKQTLTSRDTRVRGPPALGYCSISANVGLRRPTRLTIMDYRAVQLQIHCQKQDIEWKGTHHSCYPGKEIMCTKYVEVLE